MIEKTDQAQICEEAIQSTIASPIRWTTSTIAIQDTELSEIIDWVETRWLKRGKNQPNSRKVVLGVTSPDGYKFTYTAESPEDLQGFRTQLIKQI